MNKEQINQLNHLPGELRNNAQFCLWRYEKDKEGRLTKVPYNPHNPPQRASVSDPETFGTFDDAIREAKAPNVSGVGLRVSGDIVGVDIDHCISEDGELNPKAAHIVDTLDSYTEISPSGRGVRIFLKADYVAYDKETYYIKHDDLEIYIAGYTNRFLTVTGDVINNTEVLEKSAELQSILDEYFIRPKKTTQTRQNAPISSLSITDGELIEKATNAKNGALFAELWHGDISRYPSHSEADMALCNILAFWTGNDAGRIDDLFRRSGLYRDKWDERHDGVRTYGQMTIENAIASTTTTYEPKTARTYNGVDILEPAPPYELPPEDPGAVDPETGEPENAPAPEPEPEPDDVLAEFLAEIQSERFKPIKTGLEQLDHALDGGLERKTLVTLASAPGVGKTAFSQYLFENMARAGHSVIYVNLEMDRSQLLSRSIARIAYENRRPPVKMASESWEETARKALEGDVNALTVRRGYKWTDRQRDTILKALDDYRENIAPRFHYVTTNPENSGAITRDLSALMDKLERITTGMEKAGLPAPLVCIDYLQFVNDDLYTQDQTGKARKPDTADAIAEILATFKAYAMKHSTVVWVIMANNRASNKDGRASMDSGRDTSNIEYSGDVMLSLTYTAIEDRWITPELNEDGTEKTDTKGNTKYKIIDLDNINARKDICAENDTESTIAKRLCIKVVKGRSINSRKSARFIFDGAHMAFTEDTEPVEHGKMVKISEDTKERMNAEAMKRRQQ